MSLPTDFSPWEHLQTTLMQVHNRLVREEFRDVSEEDEWTPNITTPRASLRVACTMYDDDSAIQAVNRMFLFYVMLRKAADLQPPHYTVPVDRYQEQVQFAPQVTLYFREDLDEVERGYTPIDAEISFRVQNETYKTFNEAKAMSLARKLHSVFVSGGQGIRWKKGRTKLSYRDKENGYQFSVNAVSESEGKQIINKVLDVQSDSIDEHKLSVTTLASPPPIIPPVEQVYGEGRRLPRHRPVGNVRFRFAEVHVWGVGKPITLLDATLRRAHPLMRA